MHCLCICNASIDFLLAKRLPDGRNQLGYIYIYIHEYLYLCACVCVCVHAGVLSKQCGRPFVVFVSFFFRFI